MLNELHLALKFARNCNQVTELYLFSDVQYIPHGHCYLWQTPLVWLHVISDALIAIAYYSIPLTLLFFVRKVEELPFKNIFILFGAFILSCGTTHLFSIWTLWHPDYWLAGLLKAITALISLYTALTLIPLVPQALKLRSPQYLADLNQQLNEQITAKDAARENLDRLNRELERRVEEKTAAVTKANQALQHSIEFREKITDSTPNILYIYDLVEQRNVYCNSFISELLGYTPQQLKKFKDGILDELIHPDDLESVQEHFKRCLTLQDDKYLEVEYRIKNASGQWYWLHDKNTVFSRDSHGKPRQILGIAQDVSRNKELDRQLKEQISVLTKTNRARIELARMNEFVQACNSIDEARTVIADLLKPLFPDTDGAIYLLNNSKNLFEEIAKWGTTHSESSFNLNDCWAIRQGDSHLVYPQTPKLYCSHAISTADLRPTICLPMIAKGETIGMLYLRFNNSQIVSQASQSIAETVTQNIAMSFSNLKLQQELRFQSLRDSLTGLYNRRYLDESLTREIDRARRKQQCISLIMLDIDHFKRFNDTYGHSAGDLVLASVGKYLLSQIRQYDLACRYGGEELIIVMPDAAKEDAVLRAEAIRTGIKKLRLKHEGIELDSISVSIGISCFPKDAVDGLSLIQTADKALYQAKKQGRDRVIQS